MPLTNEEARKLVDLIPVKKGASMTTPETEFTTLDTCRLAEEVGFKTAPNPMTWTMLHKFAMLVREDAMKQVEALQADAERYRWLRHGDNDEVCLKVASGAQCDPDQHWLLRGESLDKTIDAARKDQP